MHHLTYDFLFPGWWTPHPLQGSRLQRPHFSNPESTFLPFQTLSYRCPNQSGKSRFWFPWSHLWSCAVHYTCYTNTAQQPLYTRGTSWCSKMLRHNYRCISICLELSLIEVPLRRAFTDEYIPWHICFMLWLGGKRTEIHMWTPCTPTRLIYAVDVAPSAFPFLISYTLTIYPSM